MKTIKPNKQTSVLLTATMAALPFGVCAETPPPTSVLARVAPTMLSGYVDVSAQWNPGTGNENNPPYSYDGGSRADGFNLNVVDLALEKALEEDEPWAAGYRVELWLGPDAVSLATDSTGETGGLALRQAYVLLHTPVCNGLEWKIGVFDSIVGYESFSSPDNVNYSRSYGFTIEPSQHTGILASYEANDVVSLSAGVANTVGPRINARADIESFKTYMGLLTLTCPDECGWLGGSTLSLGAVNGFNEDDGEGTPVRQTSFYAGTSIPTPIEGLTFGASVDYLTVHNAEAVQDGDGTTWAWGLYASYQATEKLSLHLRGEYVEYNGEVLDFGNVDLSDIAGRNQIEAVTLTAQYDVWENVLSRLEFRWDHIEHGRAFGGRVAGTPTREHAFMMAANVIYSF